MSNPDFSEVFNTAAEEESSAEPAVSRSSEAVAEEESDTPFTGEEERSVTDSAAEEDIAADDNKEQKLNKAKKEAQTKEENAKYAAARRKAERDRDRQIEQVRAETRAEVDREVDLLFSDADLVNPYTEQPIRNKEDFIAWQKQYGEENNADLKTRLRNAGIEDSEIERLWEQSDAYREMQMSLDEMKSVKEIADNERMAQTIDKELSKIRQWDDSVQQLSDIPKAKNFNEIYERVKRGYSLADAFYLTNMERLQQEAVKKAEQSVRNHLQGKDHLAAQKPRGNGKTNVPTGVMAEFKRLLPKADAEEIRRFYQKDLAHLKR